MNPRSIRSALLLLLSLFSLAALPASAQTKAERIDMLVEKYHRAGRFNGSVLVAEKGKVIYKKGVGEADMSWHIPNTTDTRFRIGSVTKQFTATLILQLVDEGKLKLDGKISDYLPEYPKENGGRVTIHHLMTHSSGIPNYTSLPKFQSEMARTTYHDDEMVALFSSLPLEFEPGTKWNYSNSGYYLLGRIIEKVTGKPYDQVLRERILDPLGLTGTGYDHYSDVMEKQATGYVRVTGGIFQRAPFVDPSVPYAAGMMYSTVEDLFKWDQALYGETFLRSATLRNAMFTPHIQGYGYGWFLADQKVGNRTVKVIEHGGAIPGFITGFRRMPEDRNTIVAMDNTSGQQVEALVAGITQILYDQPAADPDNSVAALVAETIEKSGIDAALARFRQIRSAGTKGYDFNEGEMNLLGYEYLRRGQIDRAIAVFGMNVEAHPDAFNTHDSMGEAWLLSGDTAKSIASYRRALDLNPSSRNSRDVLRRLGVDVAAIAESVTLSDATLQAYVGRYEIAPNFVLAITKEGSTLMGQATGQPKIELQPVSETRFNVVGVEAQIVFSRSGSGSADSLTLLQSGRSIAGKRMK